MDDLKALIRAVVDLSVKRGKPVGLRVMVDFDPDTGIDCSMMVSPEHASLSDDELLAAFSSVVLRNIRLNIPSLRP